MWLVQLVMTVMRLQAKFLWNDHESSEFESKLVCSYVYPGLAKERPLPTLGPIPL